MSDSKLISSADLRAEAQKLIEGGKMPKLPELLAAVAQTRQKYGPKLKAARKLGTDEEIAARAKQPQPEPSTTQVDWQSAVNNKK